MRTIPRHERRGESALAYETGKFKTTTQLHDFCKLMNTYACSCKLLNKSAYCCRLQALPYLLVHARASAPIRTCSLLHARTVHLCEGACSCTPMPTLAQCALLLLCEEAFLPTPSRTGRTRTYSPPYFQTKCGK